MFLQKLILEKEAIAAKMAAVIALGGSVVQNSVPNKKISERSSELRDILKTLNVLCRNY